MPPLAKPSKNHVSSVRDARTLGRSDRLVGWTLELPVGSGPFYANSTKFIATKESFGSSPAWFPRLAISGDFSEERTCASNFTWAIQRRQVWTKRTRSQASSSEQQGGPNDSLSYSWRSERKCKCLGPLRDRSHEKSHHYREGTSDNAKTPHAMLIVRMVRLAVLVRAVSAQVQQS